jgi:hypothetical protein
MKLPKYRPWIGIPLWVLLVILDKLVMKEHMGVGSVAALMLIVWWAGARDKC